MGPWWMNESIEIINAKTSFTVPRSDAVVARPGCIRRTGGEPGGGLSHHWEGSRHLRRGVMARQGTGGAAKVNVTGWWDLGECILK